MQLSVIIVNYNVRYFLEQALLSVRKASAGLAVEVWVVDNNSVDQSVEMVLEKFPEVRLIANRDNPGFAIANNQAIRQSTGQYVLLLNPDTVVEEDTFARCIAFMDAHPRAGGLGVRMIDGGGNYLPESKRGFPSPWVAFCKATGLAALFPRSPRFNRYYMGWLSPEANHPVEVLAGAFMLLRREVLDEIGLLDEAFFMYGEDIDLSYRIVKAGYQNYYLADTTIIHYKGESTKKGSLNYVRAFYQAMIIFARKHFQAEKAKVFILMLQAAIYLQAAAALLRSAVQRLAWPLADALLLYGGLVVLKYFWAEYYYKDVHYFQPNILYVNFPLYTAIWIGMVFLGGGYDRPLVLRRLVGGLLFGSLLLAAVYGLLDQTYRSSRAIIVLGTGWAVLSTGLARLLSHFLQYRNLDLGRERLRRLVIAGSAAETQRALQLLQQAEVYKNIIGRVGVEPVESTADDLLGNIDQLEEVVNIYRIDEIIFCSKDVSAQHIMQWMTRLGPRVLFKILPEESLSIIGSQSKAHNGELYTIDIRFQITTPINRRYKRMTDLAAALLLTTLLPLLVLVVKNPLGLLRNLVAVAWGRRSWVGYVASATEGLPPLKPGVLTPLQGVTLGHPAPATLHRLNFLYAKDYQPGDDWELLLKNIRLLGN